MKKTIVALAVATLAAPIVAQADTTLYGRVHVRLNAFDNQDADIDNGGHRLGVKSSFDLGGGLSSFARIETEIDNDDTPGEYDATNSTDTFDLRVRHAFAGLKGGFGAVSIGRQGNPYAENVYKADRHETFSGIHQSVPWRNGSSLRYNSPDLGGFNLQLAAIMEGEVNVNATAGNNAIVAEDQNALDAFAAAASFSLAGFSISLGHYSVDYNDGNQNVAPDEAAISGIGLSYNFGPGSIAAHFESDSEGAETENADISLMFDVNDDLTLGLGYSQTETANSDATPSRALLGAYYNVGKGTNVYAEVAGQDPDVDGQDSETDVSLGFRIKF